MKAMNTPTKVWVAGLSLSLLILYLGFEMGDRLGLLLGFLIVISINLMIFLLGQSTLLKTLNARKLQGQDPWNLQERVSIIAKKVNIPQPEIYMFDWDLPAAMSMGTYWHSGCLAVSMGFLKHLTEREQQAILAHQVCQIGRFDSVGFGMASLFANSLVSFATFADELWPFKFKVFSRLLSPISWLVIRLSVNKKKYLENDVQACQMIPDKRDLASAIYKMENFALAAPQSLPPCTGHLFVVNPDLLQRSNVFLHFHPKLSVRIKNILGTYPL